MQAQRLQLGAEDHLGAKLGVVERLLAERVAGEEQAPAPAIPQGEGKHAVEPFDAALALLLVEVDNALGIGAGGEAVTFGLQLRLQLAAVVNLAVEDDLDGAVLVAERLVPAGDVEDAQTGHAQAGARRGVLPGTPIVGAAMHEGGRHALQQGRDFHCRTLGAGNTEDATHRLFLPQGTGPLPSLSMLGGL